MCFTVSVNTHNLYIRYIYYHLVSFILVYIKKTKSNLFSDFCISLNTLFEYIYMYVYIVVNINLIILYICMYIWLSVYGLFHTHVQQHTHYILLCRFIFFLNIISKYLHFGKLCVCVFFVSEL